MINEEKLTIRDLMIRLKDHKINFRMHDYHAIPGGKVIKYTCGVRDAKRGMVYVFNHAGDFVGCKCKFDYFIDSI